jgi:hypothetical protein
LTAISHLMLQELADQLTAQPVREQCPQHDPAAPRDLPRDRPRPEPKTAEPPVVYVHTPGWFAVRLRPEGT